MKRNEEVLIKNAVKFNEESLLLADNEELRKDTVSLRKILQIPSDGFREDFDGLDKWLKAADGKQLGTLYSNSDGLVSKHHLPAHRREWLRNFVLTGSPSMTEGYTGIRFTKEPGYDGRNEIHIIITDNTTLEDIKNIWPEITKLQGKGSRKRQPYKNRKRNQKAYQLFKEGESLKEIANKLSEEFEGTYTDNDISHIIRRYKQKLGSN